MTPPRQVYWVTTNFDMDRTGHDFDAGSVRGRYDGCLRKDLLALPSQSRDQLEARIKQEFNRQKGLFPSIELRGEFIRIHPDPRVSNFKFEMGIDIDYALFKRLVLGTDEEVYSGSSRRKYGPDFEYMDLIIDFYSNRRYFDTWKEEMSKDAEFRVTPIWVVREINITGFSIRTVHR
ncbi:MAG TPA: hypothetical protein VJH22_00255 [Candidatus Nanoarchaeia archaeon]|nr:hypothetical protein [Candidatus Nanoarchaeia archaeon]